MGTRLAEALADAGQVLLRASELMRAGVPGRKVSHAGADLAGARLNGASLQGASL